MPDQTSSLDDLPTWKTSKKPKINFFKKLFKQLYISINVFITLLYYVYILIVNCLVNLYFMRCLFFFLCFYSIKFSN